MLYKQSDSRGIAGERFILYNGIVEVTGSIPVGSTIQTKGLAATAKPFFNAV